jgi:hypothetical protein
MDWFNRHGEHGTDAATGLAAFDQLRAADASCWAGRRTRASAGVWPTMTDDVGFAERVNPMPKAVVSRSTPRTTTWNARALEGELAAGVAALKRREDGHRDRAAPLPACGDGKEFRRRPSLTVMNATTHCPECGRPAEVRDRFALASTEGRIDHVRTMCVVRHVRTVPADRLSQPIL